MVLSHLNTIVIKKWRRRKKCVCLCISLCFFGLKVQQKSHFSHNFAMVRKGHLEKSLLEESNHFVSVKLCTVWIAKVHDSYNGYPELLITTAGAMQASLNTKLCANAY